MLHSNIAISQHVCQNRAAEGIAAATQTMPEGWPELFV